MKSKAKGSPKTRNVADLEQRIQALKRYEAWAQLRARPFEEYAGQELWKQYWQHLEMVERAMRAAQEKASEVQAAILRGLEAEREGGTSNKPEDALQNVEGTRI